jgi:paraquat-inducible protein B
VHPETRFWNAGGVDVSVGAQGVRVRANSWQQLLSGGIEFETPNAALAGAPSPAGATFQLYDNRRRALRTPHGPELVYLADFPGNLRGVEAGTAVELQGNEVGEVKEAHLKYDESRHTLLTRVRFSVDPEQIEILDMARPAGADARAVASEWLEKLVAHGLRAQVAALSFLTGQKLIALDMAPDAPAARIEHVGQAEKFPTVASGDLGEILQSLRGVLKNFDRATSGPQLGHALQSLDATLTRLDKITSDVEPDIKSLVKSLRDTADAATGTLTAVQGMMGGSPNTPADTDLPKLMRELTDAARSVRVLADYLDRHPESLLRGRQGVKQ